MSRAPQANPQDHGLDMTLSTLFTLAEGDPHNSDLMAALSVEGTAELLERVARMRKVLGLDSAGLDKWAAYLKCEADELRYFVAREPYVLDLENILPRFEEEMEEFVRLRSTEVQDAVAAVLGEEGCAA